MMDLKTIRTELRKLTAIVDGWEPSGEIPALERDLALQKLRTLYDAVRFPGMESVPESPAAEAESATVPVAIDLGAVLSLDPADETGFEPDSDAVSAPAFEAEAEPAEPFSEPDTTVGSDSAGVFAGTESDEERPEMPEAAVSDSAPEFEGESVLAPAPEVEPEAAFAAEYEPAAESGPVAEPESAAAPEPSAEPVAAPEPAAVAESAAAAEPAPAPEPASAPVSAPAPAEKPQYIAPTLFGLEEETVRHRHKQRVIMSLYDTPAPAEKPARPETAERPAERPEPAARPEPAVTPGPTVRPGFAATPEPAAASASAGPVPQSGMSVPQSAAEPVTVSEAPAAAEPEEAESGAREVAVPVGAVLGEVINHDVQTLADTIAPRRGMASELRRGEPVADLRNAIGINDKFLLIRDLFGGDGEAYEEAIATLNAFDDFDECMIHIAENYAWNPNSDGAKFMMELLERKFA